MLDQLLEKTAERAPELIGLVLLVYLFLKFLTKLLERQDAMFRELHKENIDARTHSREVIEKNTAAAAHNSSVITEMTGVMREFLHETHQRKSA